MEGKIEKISKGKIAVIGRRGLSESESVPINRESLDDVIKDFIIIHGALTTLSGTFAVDVKGYWGLHSKLEVLETVLDRQTESLERRIEDLCRLAGRPVDPEDTTHHENA